MHYPRLFEPLTLRHKTLRNRIVFGAHTANMAEAGLPGERHLAYYRERAKGGAAMIVTEPMPVHRTAILTRGNFRHSDDAVIPHFRRITEACKAEGAVMLQQLYHVGQHGDFDNAYEPYWSPSGLPSYHDADGSHAMNGREIEELIDGFVQAARRAQAAGFDGIELFGAYHSLIEQFWMPWANRRDDRWGGSFENRMRFSVTLLEKIRAQVGDDFIIGMALSVDPKAKVTHDIEQLQEIVVYHDQRELADYFTCGTGNYLDYHSIIPVFLYADKLGAEHAEALKSVVKHAVIQAESHIRTPENAHSVVSSGQADLVSIVRGQIADPHLVNKAREGRDQDIRGCISCNQMCWGRRKRDYWISCLVNPSAGREFEWGGDRFDKAKNPKQILVIGAGPAGLEAARVAAERGHKVILAEAAPQLGGQFRLAGLQPRRSQILDLIDWYERQLRQLGVEIRLNHYLEADEVQQIDADTVIVATGSLPDENGFQKWLPECERLPGVEQNNVCSVEDVLTRSTQFKTDDRIIVLDDIGDWRAAGTALHLAQSGHQVTLITPDPMVARGLQRTDADLPLRQRLRALGAVEITDTVMLEWTGDGAKLRSLLDGTEQTISADALVLALVNRPNDELMRELQSTGDSVISIGDCVASRSAAMAIYEGRKVGLSL